jgi:hypothetical protein
MCPVRSSPFQTCSRSSSPGEQRPGGGVQRQPPLGHQLKDHRGDEQLRGRGDQRRGLRPHRRNLPVAPAGMGDGLAPHEVKGNLVNVAVPVLGGDDPVEGGTYFVFVGRLFPDTFELGKASLSLVILRAARFRRTPLP